MEHLSSKIVEARACDADGRHDDAINLLAEAAHCNNVEATTQLAKRLIVGDRAPRLLMPGISLLQDAVNLGGAEAAARLAVIFATGIAGTPDWRSATQLLVVAAERGWSPAYRQLEALASMSSNEKYQTPSRQSSSPSKNSPASILADIDLTSLFVPMVGSAIHQDPQIRIYPGFLSDYACDWLINSARGRLSRALVYDVVSQTNLEDASRTNSYAVFNTMETDLVHLMAQTRISAACGKPVTHMEAPTVLHYAIGEQIGNHYDFVDPAKPDYAEDIRKFGHRIITFLIYLNSGYEGGETVFPKLGLSHCGKRGEGLLFVNTLPDNTADVRTLHNGRAPLTGEKWLFSQFIRNRAELVVG